jgi:hypothetical protein
MFRGTLRLIIVPVLIVALALLPLAAQAAPAGRSGRSAPVERSWNGESLWSGWSGAGWLAVLRGPLRGLIVPGWEKDNPPSGQIPSTPSPHSEGTGIDPHGGLRLVVP